MATQEQPIPELADKGTAKVVSSVKATAGKNGVKVVITADGTMSPNAFMLGGKRLVVDIPGTRSRVRPSVIPVRKGGLDKVRVGQHAAPDQKVRVVMDLTKPMDYTVTPEGNSLIIAMTASVATTTTKPEEKTPQEKAASSEQEKPQATEKEVSETQPQEETPAPVAAPVPMKKAASSSRSRNRLLRKIPLAPALASTQEGKFLLTSRMRTW